MPTKKQHYIPRMLLKRFSAVNNSGKKIKIYRYDKNKKNQQLVSIDDICLENYLYEIRDETGKISDKEINLIENGFSRLESVWDKIIDNVEQGRDITQKDRCMLGILLVLQLIRTPEIMKFTSDWLLDTSMNIEKPLTKNEADRCMKLASFVWGNVKPETNWILNILLEKFLVGKDVIIYHSNSDFILNGSRPVLCLKFFETSNIDNCTWFLPIAKNYCIGLGNEGTMLYRNIDKSFTQFINAHNFQNEGRFIYGSESIMNRIKNDNCIKKRI